MATSPQIVACEEEHVQGLEGLCVSIPAIHLVTRPSKQQKWKIEIKSAEWNTKITMISVPCCLRAQVRYSALWGMQVPSNYTATVYLVSKSDYLRFFQRSLPRFRWKSTTIVIQNHVDTN